MPLHLDNVENPQNALDRQSVLDIIRSVYDPLLTAWLTEPGHTWQNQFSTRAASNQFREQVIARIEELPSGVQTVESRAVLGEILYDTLRFYRFTDPAWRAPTPGAAVAPSVPAPSRTNLDMLADAANLVLSPTATTNPATPLDILAEVASSAEPSLVVSPTASLDILAAAASTLPYAPVSAPATADGPIESPAPRAKRGRDDESEEESEMPDKKKQAK